MKEKGKNFIESIIDKDLNNGLSSQKLRFRFPPEPNGYLHIGHIKAIVLNFSLGQKYNAPVNLRFDDTNPIKEDALYIEEIKKDINWLGYQWDQECYASDYFEQLYQWAHLLIDKGLAYVDSQSSEEIAQQKGTPTRPGIPSKDRSRPIQENKELFTQMKEGKFEQGRYVLRAKLSMDSPNMLLRDPVIYRIIYATHPKTKAQWCIYPMYDWTHGQSDFIEQVSHSLCSLEFMPHRALYNAFLTAILPQEKDLPFQREFSRLNVAYSMTSKRKIQKLISLGYVDGWDDPRLHTICALRRKGYTPQSLKRFVELAGVSKRSKVIGLPLLEYCIREDLNLHAERVMAVIDPIKLTIVNYEELYSEDITFEKNPQKPELGHQKVRFSRELYIERSDFMETPPKKFFRLSIGKQVRLKGAYVVQAESVIQDQKDNVVEVRCIYYPDSKSGQSNGESDYSHIKATIHWLSVQDAIDAKANVFDRLLLSDDVDSQKETDYQELINPNSKKTISIKIEKSLANAIEGNQYQFLRMGYFTADKGFDKENRIFNKTATLRDSYKP
ncbi:MAG: glutamine--tRNA ligase [Flavobacteriaceae bacterium]|nr:glutamine--tRNA ligase [Flavobacteriaceae bacterium]